MATKLLVMLMGITSAFTLGPLCVIQFISGSPVDRRRPSTRSIDAPRPVWLPCSPAWRHPKKHTTSASSCLECTSRTRCCRWRPKSPSRLAGDGLEACRHSYRVRHHHRRRRPRGTQTSLVSPASYLARRDAHASYL